MNTNKHLLHFLILLTLLVAYHTCFESHFYICSQLLARTTLENTQLTFDPDQKLFPD